MSFEEYQEIESENRVEAVFEDISHMSARERMGIVAFELLSLIEEERLAQDEVRSDWFERDKNARNEPRKYRIPFAKIVQDGFSELGMSMMGAVYASSQGNGAEADYGPDIPNELLDEPTRLERARNHIFAAKELLPDAYNLTPWQINKAEKIARRLKP